MNPEPYILLGFEEKMSFSKLRKGATKVTDTIKASPKMVTRNPK